MCIRDRDYVTGVYSTVEGMKYFYNAKNTKNAGKLNIFMASEPDHIDCLLYTSGLEGSVQIRYFKNKLIIFHLTHSLLFR